MHEKVCPDFLTGRVWLYNNKCIGALGENLPRPRFLSTSPILLTVHCTHTLSVSVYGCFSTYGRSPSRVYLAQSCIWKRSVVSWMLLPPPPPLPPPPTADWPITLRIIYSQRCITTLTSDPRTTLWKKPLASVKSLAAASWPARENQPHAHAGTYAERVHVRTAVTFHLNAQLNGLMCD